MKTGFSSFYKAKSDINNIRVKTHDEWNVECLHQIRLIAIRHFSVEKEGFGWLIGNGSIWMPGEINLLPFFAAKIKKKKRENSSILVLVFNNNKNNDDSCGKRPQS